MCIWYMILLLVYKPFCHFLLKFLKFNANIWFYKASCLDSLLAQTTWGYMALPWKQEPSRKKQLWHFIRVVHSPILSATPLQFTNKGSRQSMMKFCHVVLIEAWKWGQKVVSSTSSTSICTDIAIFLIMFTVSFNPASSGN